MNTEISNLVTDIRNSAFNLHFYLKNGLLEKVYENGLAHRLRKLGCTVSQQHPIPVRDENGTIIGEYFADLFVDQRIIVELKAVRELAPEHTAQILAYLNATKIKHGLLINFGAPKFQIKKYIL